MPAYLGKQCPKCLDHRHETFYAEKQGKRWEIDRCHHCRYNFEINGYMGSLIYFNNQIRKQNGEA